MSILTTHQTDANGKVLTEAPALIKRMAYNASNQPIYIGWAIPGTAETDDAWQITKLTYTGNNVTLITFADSNTEFDNIWSNRTTLTYG